ncbi:MAG TPA: heparinase II/III family protein [Acidobacteriaceae bacterium]|nr:heparinase II/III family protein [Acidobacteriaceae bacterium]
MRRKFVVGTGLSRVARNREGSFGLTVCCCLGLALVPASSLQASAPIVERGGYFTTAKDLARLRAQATDPRLQSAYRQTKVDSDKMVAKWEKIFPADRPAPTTAELLAFGGKSVDRDAGYASVAVECALDPTPRNKRVLREMMIADLGWRQKLNYWNGMGIHDGEATTNFLENYDVGAQLGVFTTEDHAAIRNVMHQAGHFFEGWLLDNLFSRGYEDKREQDYCLNFHVYSAASLSWIAMLYPDFPESASWLRQSESQLVEYLMNGYGEDGGYGEGSVHYWGLTTRALFNFLILSKRLGVADYLAIPAIADRLRSTLHWRLDLSAPDGNAFAIGDSDRTSDAYAILYTGGELLSDQEILWGARMMFERAKGWELKGEGANPLFLAHLDMSLMGREPTHLSSLYPLSGYATFRSGWDDQANALFFKFGTSFIGRREAQRGPVIPGHAHQDALEVELHYHGVPVVADGGRHGKYEDWATYGGFSKATVAHSTVGLGNEWGYDRLDGQYAKHQAEHGADFTYERTQQNIGRADTQLMAYGDLGQVAFSSARVRTYDAVEHQRSVVWFPGDSLTILADHLESKEEQPYEWYLTPIGNPVGKDGELVFGDDVAKVQVLPILPAGERTTTISGTTPNLPPYYVGLKGNAPLQNADRWATFSLLVLAKKAKTTDFLNVLLPFSAENNRWSVENVGASARRLTLKDKEVLVAGESADGPLVVKGQCGVVSRRNGRDRTYALIEGTGLARKGQGLISSTLKTTVWADRYPATMNALVSLPDKRASFDLRPWPLDDQLLLNPPRAVPGREPTALLLISVSFHVDAKPARMVVLHSFSGDLKLHDPDFDKEAAWPRDWHAAVYKREALPFTYDAATGMVTIELEPGEHQVVWE